MVLGATTLEPYYGLDIDQRNGLRRASDLGDPQCSWSYGGHTHLTSMRYNHRYNHRINEEFNSGLYNPISPFNTKE